MLPSMPKLLRYQNENVLLRYEKDYPNSTLKAKDALHELLKYFWLSVKHKIDCIRNPENQDLFFPCGMYPEMQEIDDMWHTFLLFTKDYGEFCQKFFGEFLHHVPKTEENSLSKEEFKIVFARYLSYIYDHLGEDTVKKWFSVLL